MSRYEVFNQLEELTKLTRTKDGYSKMIQKGDIEFYDYNVGFFDVSIYTFKNHVTDHWFVRIWFGTIDNGDYGGWVEVKDKFEADMLVEKIANQVFKNMVRLPCLDDLNKTLCQYGAWVGYE